MKFAWPAFIYFELQVFSCMHTLSGSLAMDYFRIPLVPVSLNKCDTLTLVFGLPRPTRGSFILFPVLVMCCQSHLLNMVVLMLGHMCLLMRYQLRSQGRIPDRLLGEDEINLSERLAGR